MDVRGKGTYPMRSEMTVLEYLMDAPYKCSMNDVNMMAFEEAATIIGGHQAIKEFLAYLLSSPLSPRSLLSIAIAGPE
jgi:hypothetical protein